MSQVRRVEGPAKKTDLFTCHAGRVSLIFRHCETLGSLTDVTWDGWYTARNIQPLLRGGAGSMIINIEERPMNQTYDAIIIGAGVMGASIAFHLAERGLKVCHSRTQSHCLRSDRSLQRTGPHAL